MSVVMESACDDVVQVPDFSHYRTIEVALEQNTKPQGRPKSEDVRADDEVSVCERITRFQSLWERKSFDLCHIENIRTFHKNDLYMMKLLGRGAFSDVHLAYLQEDSDTVYAVKRLNTLVLADKKQLQICATDLALETAILSCLNHENITSLYGVAEGNMHSQLQNGSYFLALELLSETLHDRFKRWAKQRKRQVLSTTVHVDTVIDRLEDVVLGVVRAMEYLHSHRIIYRDMKPKNIGFSDLNDEVKLFDFGFARCYDTDSGVSRLMTGGIGTPRYMAPEVARHDAQYTSSVDVYSFSVMLWQVVTSRVPFNELKTTSQLAAKVIMGNRRPRIKLVPIKDLRKLIESGWSSDPSERKTFTEIRERLEKIIKQHRCSSAERESIQQERCTGLEFSKLLSSTSLSSVRSTSQGNRRRRTLSRRLSGSLLTNASSLSAQQQRNENDFNRSVDTTGSEAWSIPEEFDTTGGEAWSISGGVVEAKRESSEVSFAISDTISESTEYVESIEKCNPDKNYLNCDGATRANPFFQRTKWQSKRRNSTS